MSNGWTGGQYSIFRALLGLCLGVGCFGLLLPQFDRFTVGSGAWLGFVALLALGFLFSLAIALGWQDRLAGIVLAVGGVLLLPGSPLYVPCALTIGALVLHVATPPAPYGSLAARGRADPGNSWQLPGDVYAAGWVLLCVALVTVSSSVWFLAVLFALAVPSAYRPARPFCWLGLLVLTVALVVAGIAGVELVPLLLLLVFAFDPAWVPAPTPAPTTSAEPEQLFYDGHCGLCHRAVRFVLAEDRTGDSFRFAPLDSAAFHAAVPGEVRKNLPDSIVVRTADGTILTRAGAVFHIMRQLGGMWRLIGELSRMLPVGLLDAAYDGVARIRHRLFAKPPEACPILPPKLRNRFQF